MLNQARIQAVQKAKFKNGGRDIEEGLDCWGTVMYLSEGYGTKLPDFNIDAMLSPLIHNKYKEQKVKHYIDVKENELREGDIVYMNIDPRVPDLIHHFGIYIGDQKFIHTTKNTRPVVTSIDHPLWKHRIKGFARWIGK